MTKISVIIPVYNAQNYIDRCLDSVCNQTLEDIEIICVDDCSKDNSLEILNTYAKNDNRIKVIHCETNGGESKARNIGLDNAKGEYLAFVDNDDTIDSDFLEKLYDKALKTGADIVKGEARVFNYDNSISFDKINELVRKNNSKLFFLYYWWTAIYKTELIKNNNIKLLEGYPLGGDVLFLNKALLLANKLELVDGVYYNYYRREDSGDSKILSFEKIKSALDIHEMIVDNTLQYPKLNELSTLGLNALFVWCLNTTLLDCFRSKSTQALDYSVNKAFSIYDKTSSYILDETPIAYPICMHILSTGTVEDLKEFYLKNNTHQKMFIANLRYLHNNKKKGTVDV